VATWSAWNAPRRSGPQTDTHASFVSQSILSDSVGRILLFAPLTQPSAYLSSMPHIVSRFEYAFH
jgi:hypothetical protein